LQDISISNTAGTTNMVNFQGPDNSLHFSGTSILDMNTGASGYAMIHVNSSTSLVVGGTTPDDTLYFYKREQGAGIGGNGGAAGSEGQAPEYNGAITITQGHFFMKNSKQGALIGSGAGAASTTFSPGPITIQGGILNLIAISRSSAIGGGAGATGAADGTHVSIYPQASININVDFSGSAIGGGGYDMGNASDGGVLHYLGGSIRTFADTNAVDPNGDGNTADSLWGSFGIFEAGVDARVITATVLGLEGEALYPLAFDTSLLDEAASTFEVLEGGTVLYVGGLHAYSYLNEALSKDSQIPIEFTLDNWVALDDPHLYLYLTAEEHELEVNGQEFVVAWNAEAGEFSVTPATTTEKVGAPGSGDLDGDDHVTATEALIVARCAIGLNSSLTPAQRLAADMDGDGFLTMADALIIMRRSLGL
jgi:hypothetical protein